MTERPKSTSNPFRCSQASRNERVAKQPRTKFPSNTSFEKHQEAIQIMFSTNNQIEGGKIHDEVITAYSMIGIDFGLSVARRFLTYLIKKKLIIHLPHQKGNKTFYLLPVTDEK